MNTYRSCDRRSIVHAFAPAARERKAWFASLDLPRSIRDWTPERIASAEIITRSQPIVGALILHTYLVHDECEHQGRQPTGPEESRVVLAIEECGDSGEIVPVRDPYSDDPVVGFEWFIGAWDSDQEPGPDDVTATGKFLRVMAQSRLRPVKAVSA